MGIGVGGAWLVLDTGKGGLKEKRLGTTVLWHTFLTHFTEKMQVYLLEITTW